MPATHILKVWGDFACFTRPELKAERMSYPVITPSAARGILDSIFLKPSQFRWQVRKVEVLEEPSYIALRRNEVKDRINPNAVAGWMSGDEEPEPLWADGDRQLLGTDEKGRTQRQTMALKNVHYRLHAEMLPWPGQEHLQPALESQFLRRVERGKCFQQPYLGCREFPAFFERIEAMDDNDKQPIPRSEDLGFMVYDVFDLSRPGSPHDGPFVSLFRARLDQGVMEVPAFDSPEVLKPERRA